MTCQDVQNLVTDYFEDSLSAAERAEIEAHLKNCPRCRTFFSEYAQTVRQIRRLRLSEVPALKREFLFQNIRKNLRQINPSRPQPARKRLAWVVVLGALILFSLWNYRWRRKPPVRHPSFFGSRVTEFLLEEHDISSMLSPLSSPSPLFLAAEERHSK